MRPHFTRRDVLKAALPAFSLSQLALSAQVSSKAEATKLGMPGLFRGRVVEVSHSGCLNAGKYQAEPVQQMMRAGLNELTGAGGWNDSWRLFAQPGDVVGIKVNPVGAPDIISAPEVLREIIGGLNAAGIKNRDIVVYDRYHDQFIKAGFPQWLPDGVRWMSATKDFDLVQHAIEGYDPDHFMDIGVTLHGYDATNLTARRSYAAKFITREVNKLINLCVLKDHGAAGVTLSLKNLSHGLVNNVNRSHSTKGINVTGAFIPSVVSLPVIRNKAVLHILDAVKGQYQGGPGPVPQFIWEPRTLYFATDPVALDHVGWRAIDEKRLAAGLKIITEAEPDKYIARRIRQPEHIEIAGAMGLGEWDWEKTTVRKIALA
ncbi:MAG: DUF362 domain-containing protein [Bryobacteraceae bacterium]